MKMHAPAVAAAARFVLTALAVALPATAGAQRMQSPPLGETSVSVEAAKLFVGQNFRFLTSSEEVVVGVPLRGRSLLVVRQGLTYATAGTRSSSWQLSNLLVGVATERRGTRGELTLSLPTNRWFGDSDYAEDLALLSGLDYRERYVHRWGLSGTVSHAWLLEDRSRVGLETGLLGLTATGDNAAQAVGRYGLFLVLPLARQSMVEVHFHGTAHLNGTYKSFSDRMQNGATVSFWFEGPGPLRGLFAYYPLDDGTREFVNGVVGARFRF